MGINRKPCVSLGDKPQTGNFQISCMRPRCISLEIPLKLGYEIVSVCVSEIKNGIKEEFNQVSQMLSPSQLECG